MRHLPPIGLLRTVAGWILIGLGVIGLFLPILQGTILLLAGAAMLGPRSYPGRRIRITLWRIKRWLRKCRTP